MVGFGLDGPFAGRGCDGEREEGLGVTGVLGCDWERVPFGSPGDTVGWDALESADTDVPTEVSESSPEDSSSVVASPALRPPNRRGGTGKEPVID